MKISSYKAYLDEYVDSMNQSIMESSGVSDSISAMYEVVVGYYRLSEIGWEEKSDTMVMYVTGDKYYVLIGAES